MKTWGRGREKKTLSSDEESSTEQSKLSSPPSYKRQPIERGTTTKDINVILPSPSMNTAQASEQSQNVETSKLSTECNHSCKKCCGMKDERTLIQSILTQTNVVKYIVSDVLQKIKQINKISDVPPEQPSQTLATRIKDVVKLPLDDTENLEKFNEALDEITLYNIAVNDLAKLGGRGIDDFIKRACLTLLTHKVGAEYSYYGKKGKKKFLKLNVGKVLIEPVIISTIFKWFHYLQMQPRKQKLPVQQKKRKLY
ncbi:unnamed protein product [Diabrotica balteata]|uniref:DUF4806 domain-containing protein n=1 Tax=Diabrotica balteata TaxID=107213 RepID=A0A9N9SNM2_DIABA|nr:unnamed protein product [Diabrotica balteata]